jgi:hypothetical protein
MPTRVGVGAKTAAAQERRHLVETRGQPTSGPSATTGGQDSQRRQRHSAGKDLRHIDAQRRPAHNRPAPWGAVPPVASVRLAPLRMAAAMQRKP